MNKWKYVLPATVLLLLAGKAAAQDDDDERIVIEGDAVWVEKELDERNADVERQLYEAERRMNEAARQIHKLTVERLPSAPGYQRLIEIISDDKPRLGVSIGNDAKGAVKGVAIVGVTPGSAADDAGLRSGDTITSINGESLAAPDATEATEKLLDFMSGVEMGDTLDLGYLRDGKSGKVQVEPRPVQSQVFAFSGNGRSFAIPSAPEIAVVPGVPSAPNTFAFRWLMGGWGDLEMIELNEGLGKYFGTDEGLLVVNAPDSTELQLEDGDVIQKIDGREPTSVRHALRILGSYQAGESLKLEIMRDKKRKTLEVEIPNDLSSGLMQEAPPASVRPVTAPAPSTAPLPPRPTERT